MAPERKISLQLITTIIACTIALTGALYGVIVKVGDVAIRMDSYDRGLKDIEKLNIKLENYRQESYQQNINARDEVIEFLKKNK